MKSQNRKDRAWYSSHWTILACVVLCLAILARAYLKPKRVAGASDAPSFLVGDMILLNELAYDVRLPYSDYVLLTHSEPQHGDVVQYRQPGAEYLVFKRIVGCPGDTLQIKDHHLTINSVALSYEVIPLLHSPEITTSNQFGSVIEVERGLGPEHMITYSPAENYKTADTITVPPGYFYVLGDNRSNSLDSRHYGPIPRKAIRGEVSSLSGVISKIVRFRVKKNLERADSGNGRKI